MRRWISGNGGQSGLFKLEVHQMLPADHPAREVVAMVEQLDLSEFEAYYRLDGQGRPPFCPTMMVALIFYCYGKGFRTSQQIATACRDDRGCELITGGLLVSRSAIDSFEQRHSLALRRLLPQTIRLGHGEGLVDVGEIAGDGTIMKANASKAALVGQDRLEQKIAVLEDRVADQAAAWEQVVLAGLAVPDEPGGRAGEAAPWRRMTRDARLLERRRAALARLRARPSMQWQEWSQREQMVAARLGEAELRLAERIARQEGLLERYAQAQGDGRRWLGTVPVAVHAAAKVVRARASVHKWKQRAAEVAAVRPGLGKVNMTDPDSALMPGKRGGYAPAYNVQAVACRNQFVLSVGLHSSSNDKQALIPALNDTRANLDEAGVTDQIGVALFDAGYASDANFTADIPVKALLVSVTKERQQTGRTHETDASTASEKWAAMSVRLADPDNAELYKHRGAMIEPVFAQFFASYGRELSRRGIEDVTTELHMWAVAHNLRKIMRSRAKRKAG